MRRWSEVMGVGPWFSNPRASIEKYTHDGESRTPHDSAALANSGYVQAELIQTRGDRPSMYRDFMQAGRGGLQHVVFRTEGYDADLARMPARGFTPKMGGATDPVRPFPDLSAL